MENGITYFLKANEAGEINIIENNRSMKKRRTYQNQVTLALSLMMGITLLVNPVSAQSSETEPYPVGKPLGMPADDGTFEPISSNVVVYGGIYGAESCSYDPERGAIVVPNRGAPQNAQTNDAWVSLINHDGSVHTLRWIGVQNSDERKTLAPPLVLNEPFGSDIINGSLYVADRDGGTSDNDPSVAVVRHFYMKTGAPVKEIRIEDSPWINDLEVKEAGTVYATQTGDFGDNPNPDTWKVWKVSPEGKATVLVQGPPLNAPNGIAFDPDGNLVVANYGNAEVLTFSESGELLKTENAAQAGSDGLVIMPDGTKYVCSVRYGGVSRIRPGETAELIARNIPSAASMCYDAGANQLVIPMNANNGLAFVPLD